MPEGHTANGNWHFKYYSRRGPKGMRLIGWLTNVRTGNRYVFNLTDGKMSYMREYRPPSNIPIYVTDELKEVAASECEALLVRSKTGV